MLIGAVEAEPMVVGIIAVEVAAVETRIVEFRTSCRRILPDRGVFHKHHNRPQGSRLGKVR